MPMSNQSQEADNLKMSNAGILEKSSSNSKATNVLIDFMAGKENVTSSANST